MVIAAFPGLPVLFSGFHLYTEVEDCCSSASVYYTDHECKAMNKKWRELGNKAMIVTLAKYNTSNRHKASNAENLLYIQ